jgi:hypothetical protein
MTRTTPRSLRGFLIAAVSVLAVPAGAADLSLSPGDDLVTLMSGLAPGDTVQLAAGDYVIENTIHLNELAGTEGSPIIVRASGEGAPVIKRVGGGRVFQINTSSHVRLIDLEITGGDGWEEVDNEGIHIGGGSSDIVIRGLNIHHIRGSGIRVGGDVSNLSVTDVHIHDNPTGFGISAGCGDGSCWLQDSLLANNWIHDLGDEYAVGIQLRRGAQGNRILDNVIHGLVHRGIEVLSTGQGERNVIERNAIWNVGRDGIYVGGSALVRNNVVFDAGRNGIVSNDDLADDYDDVVISFNTVVGTGEDGIEFWDWAGHTGMVLANNVVSNPTGYAMESQFEVHYDENAYISGNVVTGLVRGLEELRGHFVPGNGASDFMDAPGWDYYPSSGSALLDQADPSGEAFIPEVDFNGLPREGDTPDVGAYEVSARSNPGWLLREGFKEDTVAALIDEEIGGCDCGDDTGGAGAAFLLPFLMLGGLRRRRP